MDNTAHFVRLLSEINKEDVDIVGRETAELGELSLLGIQSPPGFVVTNTAFVHFLKDNNLDIKIKHLLTSSNLNNLKSLHQTSSNIKKLVMDSSIPFQITSEIIKNYNLINEPLVSTKLYEINNHKSNNYRKINNYEKFVKGDAVLIDRIKLLWSTLFDAKEIYYRNQRAEHILNVKNVLLIQKALNTESSGTIQTSELRKQNELLIIKASLGILEENNGFADIYEIKRKDMQTINKYLTKQDFMYKINENSYEKIPVLKTTALKQKISDEKINELAKTAVRIQNHYYFPVEIFWQIENNNIFITNLKHLNNQTDLKLEKNLDVNSTTGLPKFPGIALGPAKIIKFPNVHPKIYHKDVIICKEPFMGLGPYLNLVSAIVVENENENNTFFEHIKKLGIPCIIGAKSATEIFKNEEIVTVNGATGIIIKGGSRSKEKQVNKINYKKTATKLFVSLKNIDNSKILSDKNADGAFLLNSDEIIIKNGVHPKKLIKEGKQKELVNKISDYLSVFCSDFNHKPVIYQTTNITSDLYRKLKGGEDYEQYEPNPALGFRGGYRYIHDQELIKLELEAVKNTIQPRKINNLWLMIPYLRSLEELIIIKKIILKSGLERSSSFKLFISIDLPINAFIIEDFAKAGIDGISINLNLLTSIAAGIDKNNLDILSEIKTVNVSIKNLIKNIIKTASEQNLMTSIIIDNPDEYSELIKNLVSWGISTISVPEDAFDSVKKLIINEETRIINYG